MFDVPVQEVTVSSSPVLISVGHVTDIALTKIPSALRTGVTALPQLSSSQSGTVAFPSIAQARTLLPQTSFQVLEPLNLAAVAAEPVFVLPAETAPSQVAEVFPASMSPASAPIAVISASNAPADPAAQAASNGESELEDSLPKTAPVLRDDLKQCVDLDQPESWSQAIVFQVLKQGTVIGDISSAEGAESLVQSLQELLGARSFNADDITPLLGRELPTIRLGSDVSLNILSPADAQPADMKHEWAAIAWSDHLRQALGASPLDAGDVQVMFKELQPSEQQLDGLASWYGPYFHGRLTANGETFDQTVLTAAHKTLPFDTLLQVRNMKNNRTVVVRINDRGPYIGKRSLDLSKAAAQCLGSEETGVIPYEAVILEQSPVETALVE